MSTLVTLGLVLGGLYLAGCAVWPYTRCSHCQGGRVRSPGRSAWRRCRRCGGKGERLRLGAFLLGRRRE